jgi:hypothetical protein
MLWHSKLLSSKFHEIEINWRGTRRLSTGGNLFEIIPLKSIFLWLTLSQPKPAVFTRITKMFAFFLNETLTWKPNTPTLFLLQNQQLMQILRVWQITPHRSTRDRASTKQFSIVKSILYVASSKTFANPKELAREKFQFNISYKSLSMQRRISWFSEHHLRILRKSR